MLQTYVILQYYKEIKKIRYKAQNFFLALFLVTVRVIKATFVFYSVLEFSPHWIWPPHWKKQQNFLNVIFFL